MVLLFYQIYLKKGNSKMNLELKKQIEKIPEIFQLEFKNDNRYFIDPYRIDENKNEISKNAKTKIVLYFDSFFKMVKQGERNNVRKIGEHLHEINATKLGYTKKESKPKGKGFSERDLLIIYDEARKAKKDKKDIKDMPDILVFAENVGPDKVSDLTTNIVYEELLNFTILIIYKYKLDIEFRKKKKWIFDEGKNMWQIKELNIPFVDNEEIIFLPREWISKFEIFSYGNVYDKLVYPYYKVHTSIHGLIRILKNNVIRPDCKKIKEKFPRNRETVQDFRSRYGEKYEQFKNEMINEHWRK